MPARLAEADAVPPAVLPFQAAFLGECVEPSLAVGKRGEAVAADSADVGNKAAHGGEMGVK